MPDDVLMKPAATWTREDLDDLMGRTESELLELKGSSTNISSREGRQAIAREVAGMVSASGGFIVVGTVRGEDVVTGFPGVEVQPEDVDALRRSLLDRVRPVPVLIQGPIVLDADEAGKSVLVLQVFGHPTGLPASADGRYWLRQHDETRPMSYDEVKTRVEAAASSLQPAERRAEEELSSIAVPLEDHFRSELSRRGHPGTLYEAMRVAVVPARVLQDLGQTGSTLANVLRRAVELDEAVWRRLDAAGEALFGTTGASPVRANGVDLDMVPFRRLRTRHDGAVAVAHNIVYPPPWEERAGVNVRLAEQMLVRSVSVATAFLHQVLGPSELLVEAHSGTIPGLLRGSAMVPDAVHPGSSGSHSFVTFTSGESAVIAISAGGNIFASRIADSAELHGEYTSDSRLRDYLEGMFLR